MNITTLSIYLAKNTFSIVGMNQDGKVICRKTLTRIVTNLYRAMPTLFNRHGSL